MKEYLFYTLSPIHIGNGSEKHYPFDCVIKNGYLVDVDLNRYTIDDLKKIIKEFKEKKDHKEKIKKLREISEKYALSSGGIKIVEDIANKDDIVINEFINIDGKPYIPGSSIKGTFVSYTGPGSVHQIDEVSNKPTLSYIIFRDVMLEKDSLTISRIYSLSMKKINRLIKYNYIEVIPPGKKINAEIIKNEFYHEKEVRYLENEKILEKIKDINSNLIKGELNWIRNFKNKIIDLRSETIKALNELEEFYKKIEQENKNNILIRIGKGKFSENSTTIKITKINEIYYPFGWVRVEPK
ncbi:MAG: type III-A CRISPR-associated RAMP protein Csm5 [Candidatus Anstonellales archaeon]